VFGELCALLDQPHTADVRALEASQFHVANADTLCRVEPFALFYIFTVLARRLDGANQALIELKRQVQAGEPRSVIGKTVETMEELLGAGGAKLAGARSATTAAVVCLSIRSVASRARTELRLDVTANPSGRAGTKGCWAA
jgi:hypothetical protein